MTYSRDASPETDWTGLLIWGTVLVGGAFAFKKFVLDKQAAAPATPALPAAPATPQLPPPGVVIPPGTPGSAIPATPAVPLSADAGNSASMGDAILVDVSQIANVPGLAQLAGSQPEIQMTVVAAVPGLPTVLAVVSDPLVSNPPATPFAVPRAAIAGRQAGGGTLPAVVPVPVPGATPSPGQTPVPTIPGLPGLAFVPVDLGNPMAMQQGHHYRARIQLDGVQAIAASLDPSVVASQFQSLGFPDAKIYKAGVDALPADWPAVTIVAPTSGTYYGEGTWSQASASIPRPPQIAMAWEQ